MRDPLAEFGRQRIPYDMANVRSARMGPAALGQGIQQGAANAYRAARDQERLQMEVQNQRFQQAAELWKQQQYQEKVNAKHQELNLRERLAQVSQVEMMLDQQRKASAEAFDQDARRASWRLRAEAQAEIVRSDEAGRFFKWIPKGGSSFEMQRVYGDQGLLRKLYEQQNAKGRDRDVYSEIGSLSQSIRNLQPGIAGDDPNKERRGSLESALDRRIEQLKKGKPPTPQEKELLIQALREKFQQLGRKR